MNDKNNINSLQVGVLLFYVARASFFGIGLNEIEKIAHQDAWLSILIGAVIGLIPLFIYIYISKRYPNQNILEIITTLFGKIIGSVINFILLIIILYMSATIFICLILFIQTNLIIRTPNLVISIIFLIPISLAAIKGLEVFSRMGLILFVGAITIYTLGAIGLIPYLEIQNIKPTFEYGIYPIIKGALYYVSITVTPLFLILIIPQKNITDTKYYNRSILGWYLFVNIITFITLFWTLTVLGPKLVTLYNFPTYTILKKISFLDFIERVENNVVWNLLLDSIFILILSLYFIKEITISTLGIKKKKWEILPIIISSLILLIISSFLIPNIIEIHFILIKSFGLFLGISIFLLTIIIFIRALFDKNQTT
ncbi:MAG: GerAB/ArcD/ProY family transporter [Bacilli bacterium]|nr:GerAB/ArcD/ProY family transporter [Bacilli bacterium]